MNNYETKTFEFKTIKEPIYTLAPDTPLHTAIKDNPEAMQQLLEILIEVSVKE